MIIIAHRVLLNRCLDFRPYPSESQNNLVILTILHLYHSHDRAVAVLISHLLVILYRYIAITNSGSTKPHLVSTVPTDLQYQCVALQ